MKLKQQNLAEVLSLLLLTDLVLILIHIASFSPVVNGRYWEISFDRGFGETFQYLKEFWLICSFAALIKIRSDWSYLSLSLLFCYLLVDDSFFIHERLGNLIAKSLNFQPLFGLRANDFGELIVNAIAGGFFLLMIGSSYWLGSKKFRFVCKRVVTLLGCLAFCGIVLDMLNIMSRQIAIPFLSLESVLELAEDGGEMIIMSVLCWHGISLLRQKHPQDPLRDM